MTSWSSRPSIADGFAGGRAVTVTAGHQYLWKATPQTLARVGEEGSWRDVPGMSVEVQLKEAATLRFLYSMTVRSDQVRSFALHKYSLSPSFDPIRSIPYFTSTPHPHRIEGLSFRALERNARS